MRITRLVLSDFGKFHQQEFVFSKGLNIATGPNEAGKTTLRRFIRSMFYGLERQRGIKARMDDYSRLKPWEHGRFQGIMEFEAEGKKYRLFRNFLTSEKEMVLTDLSTGRDENNPAEILQTLGLQSEAVYTNTFWIGNACVTEELLAEELKDYLVNLAYSGGAGLNLQKSLEWLARQKKMIVKQMPEEELSRCMEQMLAGETAEKQKEEAEQALEGLLYRQKVLSGKIKEDKVRAADLRKDLEKAEEAEKKEGKKASLWTVAGVLFLGILSAAALFNGNWVLIPVGGILSLCSFFTGYRLRKQKKQKESEKEILSGQLYLVTAEMEACYEELTVLLPETEQKKLRLEQAEEQVKQCETAAERYEELIRRKQELEREAAAVTLAADTLEELSDRLYKEFEEKFGEKLSGYAKAFTDHAYETLVADEELNLKAVTKDRSLGIAEVSFGTAEQFYLALRFAAADVFDPEKNNPIILDDSFAAFDEQRLESAILALAGCGRQVILLSSTGREETAAKRMGITYEAVFK